MPRKDKLTPVPDYQPPVRARKGKTLDKSKNPKGPDLSHIADALRPFAVAVAELDFFANNPRKHEEEDLKATAASLREFGQVELLVVNRRPSPPVVLNGNGRLQAALSMNWSHVAVHFVDLDDARAALLATVLNRTGQLAGWDKDLLKATLDQVQTPDQDLADMLTALAEAEKLIPPEPTDPDPRPAATPEEKAKVTCPHCGQEFEVGVELLKAKVPA